MKKRLGEILIERQLLTVDQLNVALAHHRQWSMRLGAALVAKGFITEGALTRVLSEFLGIPMVDLSKVVVDQKAMEVVSVAMCEQHDVFPISLKQQKGRRVLLLAMADPLNFSAIDELAFRTGCTVQPAIAQLSSVSQAIRRFYHGQKAVVIAPLDFERTPLSSSGRPVVDRAPIDVPPASGSRNWLGDVERPALGGPGREPLTVSLEARVPDEELPILGELFSDEPTGTFAVTKASPGAPPPRAPVPPSVKAMEWDANESMEMRFWALVRALAARGLVTKEEFLAQLRMRE